MNRPYLSDKSPTPSTLSNAVLPRWSIKIGISKPFFSKVLKALSIILAFLGTSELTNLWRKVLDAGKTLKNNLMNYSSEISFAEKV